MKKHIRYGALEAKVNTISNNGKSIANSICVSSTDDVVILGGEQLFITDYIMSIISISLAIIYLSILAH